HAPLRPTSSASSLPQAPPPTPAILTAPPNPIADCGLLIADCVCGFEVCQSAIRNPQSAIDSSRCHSSSGPEPVLRAVDQPPDIGTMRGRDQQNEHHARREGVDGDS